MLLVMLMSVTGAWATDTGTDNLSAMCLETQNIKVTPAGVSDLTHIHEVVIWEYNNKTKIEAKNGVKIKEIFLQGCTGVGIPYGVSASGASEIINDVDGFYTINFTNGVTSTIIGPGNGYPGNANLFAMAINVTYEYPDHTHSYAGNWTHDDECHWHECTSLIGLCKDNQGSKAPHNYGDSGEAYYTCQTCGYVNVQRKHVHVPADTWSHDAFQHWHACTSAVGTCDANGKLDLANHTYGQDGAARYTCSVCNYVNETRKNEFVGIDYLSFTAVDGDMTIGMAKTGSPDDYTMQYSLDKIDWYTVALTATNSNIVEIEDGQTCYFRHGSATAATHISSSDGNYWSFIMTSTSDDATIEAGGNIMSLLDATCQKTELPMSPQHVFTKLFFNCEKLTVAPRMDAITSVPQWGFVSMFSGSGIKTAPALSATYIRDGAYRAMFENCKELVSVPVLHATSLNRCAYWDMFKGCDKLASIEITNIESMVVEEGSTGRENSFHDMLAGTAMETNGVIIAPIEMMGDTRITLPSNWQWATKLKANEDPDNDGNFYTTFFDSRFDYKVENGFKAYTGIITTTEDDERELRLTATPNKIIPKGDGVIIHGGSGEVLLTVSNGSAERADGNVLTGSDTDTTAPDFCYILSYGQQRLGFYRYEDGKTLSAHKAYLTYEPVPGVLAKALRMVFVDDEVDGIESISCDSANSPIGIYSVSGVRLNKLQKGINIVNGKKVLVK